MSKKVLAIFYSQTGQLRNIIDNCCAPFEEDGVEVEKVNVKLRNDYLFPWTGKSFFSVMPDCVLGIPSENNIPYCCRRQRWAFRFFIS